MKRQLTPLLLLMLAVPGFAQTAPDLSIEEASGEAEVLVARARSQAEISRRDQEDRRMSGPVPVQAVKTVFFVQMLPGVKDFAVATCRAPGQIPVPEEMKRPFETIKFLPVVEDEEANRLSAPLGLCERRLFRRLISVIRYGDPKKITPQWLRDVVREYSAA